MAVPATKRHRCGRHGLDHIRVDLRAVRHGAVEVQGDGAAPLPAGYEVRAVISSISPRASARRGAIIASGSVVVADVPDYGVVGGNPAKLIRRRQAGEVLDNRDPGGKERRMRGRAPTVVSSMLTESMPSAAPHRRNRTTEAASPHELLY